MGAARKLVTDLTLARSVKRTNQKGVLYIETEDADLNKIDRKTVSNLVTTMDKDPNLDAVRGVQDRMPETMMKNDLFFLNRRARDIMEVLLRHPDYRPEKYENADFVWNRVITGGRNSAYTAEMYAKIGGYNPTMKMGEDMYIGQGISVYRGIERGTKDANGRYIPDTSVIGTVASRTDSSPRRFLDAYYANK